MSDPYTIPWYLENQKLRAVVEQLTTDRNILFGEAHMLRAEVKQLRAALQPFAYEYQILMLQQDSYPSWHSVQTRHLLNASRALRAMEPKPTSTCSEMENACEQDEGA